MALSVLDDKSREPDEAMLADVLGQSNRLWEAVLAYLAQEYPGVQNEWGFAGAQYGWSLRPKQKKRTILYLIPQKDGFLVAFVLGERAVAAAKESPLPAHILEAIRTARPYAEGRGIRFEVRRRDDIHVIQELVKIKMLHGGGARSQRRMPRQPIARRAFAESGVGKLRRTYRGILRTQAEGKENDSEQRSRS